MFPAINCKSFFFNDISGDNRLLEQVPAIARFTFISAYRRVGGPAKWLGTRACGSNNKFKEAPAKTMQVCFSRSGRPRATARSAQSDPGG